MLEAKCPNCIHRAKVDMELTYVKCKNCGYGDNYDNYIETMKGKAENMATDFHMNGEKR